MSTFKQFSPSETVKATQIKKIYVEIWQAGNSISEVIGTKFTFFFKSSDTIKTVIKRLLSETDVGTYTTHDKLLLFSSSDLRESQPDLRESQPIQNDKKLEDIDTKFSIIKNGKTYKYIKFFFTDSFTVRRKYRK